MSQREFKVDDQRNLLDVDIKSHEVSSDQNTNRSQSEISYNFTTPCLVYITVLKMSKELQSVREKSK